MHFVKQTRIAANAAVVFAFHERPDAFELLVPPWQKIEIVKPPSSLAVGTRVELKAHLFGITQNMVFEHVAYDPGRSFADRQVKGPFTSWLHHHVVIPDGDHHAVLSDEVDYDVPGSFVGRAIAHRQLVRLFEFRHEVTRRECERPAPAR